MMNDAEIRRYAGLMAELGLTGLEVTEKDQVIRLERSPAPAAARETVAVPPAAPAAATPQGARRRTRWRWPPHGGVFYAAPAEDAEPFVKVGDKVKRGQTLCIVEAMKLMNEIMAEVDGGDRGDLRGQRPGGGLRQPPLPHSGTVREVRP